MPEISHQPCPDVEGCGSSDAYSYNEEDMVGYCHACELRSTGTDDGEWFHFRKNGKIVEPIEASEPLPTVEEIQQEQQKINKSFGIGEEKFKPIEEPLAPTVVGFRGISKETVNKYGVTVDVDTSGTPVRHSYPYPNGTKYRYLPKDFSRNSGLKNEWLFGMDKFNAGSGKYVTVCEGEVDTLSVFEMLGRNWPVVGTPGATVPEKLLVNCKDWLDSFEQIIIVPDNDKAGSKLVDKLVKVFPNKVHIVSITKYKDANEFLVNGDTTDFKFAWSNRQKYVPPNIYHTQKQFKDILSNKETANYIPTPITAFNDTAKGLMQGHFTVITGMEGQGKTEVLRMFEHHILKHHPDTPIGLLHMEENMQTTLRSFACYEMDVNLRDPEIYEQQDKDEVNRIINRLTGDRLFMFDMWMDEDPLKLLDQIRYLTEVHGCKYVFIDPIQQLAYRFGGLQTEEQILTQMSVQMARLATDFNVGIVATAHVNDDGNIRSSRMIGKSASVRIDLYRDHMAEDPKVRNTSKLYVSKNRPVGTTGFGGELLFDTETFKLEEA